MKAEKFSESLNNVQDKYIEETVQFQAHPAAPKKRASVKVWRTIAIVASSLVALCIIITAVGLSLGLSGSGGAKSAENSDIPYEAERDKNGTGSYAGGGAMIDGTMNSYLADSDITDSEPIEEGLPEEAAAAGETGSSAKQKENKIIYTASMRVSTKDFSASETKIEELMKKYNGFYETMDVNNSSSSFRTAYYQIRIPAESLDAFLKDAEEIGTVASLNRSGTDVSESYYDTEFRLETAKKKLARLQELLAQAKDISDIIAIEESISEVEFEIDDLTGSLKHYDSDVKYSTVSINLEEVYSPDGGNDSPLSFGERISQGFKDGLSTFATVGQEVLIWLAASWIWILIIGIVIAAVILIIVKSEKRSKKK